MSEKMKALSRSTIAVGLIFLVSMSNAFAIEAPRVPTQVQTGTHSRDLAELIRQMKDSSGIQFKVPTEFLTDKIEFSGALSSEELSKLLKGYNWMGIQDVSGSFIQVTITGRNGDGAPPSPKNLGRLRLFHFKAPPKEVPESYRGLPKGSVYAVEVSTKALREMSLGEKLSLSLPSGEHDLVHDNVLRHPNGDKTWVGKMDGPSQALYRTSITLGDGDQLQGQILTPEGLYLLESDDHGQWLIDIKASGLQQGAFDVGGQPPVMPLPSSPSMVAGASSLTGTSQGPGFSSSKTGVTQASIDMLLLYSDTFSDAGIETRLNSLVAYANQAMMDSQVGVQLNLVGIKKVNYADDQSDQIALNQLTLGQDGFKAIASHREKLGADLVLLVRPFKPIAQDNTCGEAWVNGSAGSPLSPDLAYGVVNEGRAGGYYCSNYTLAHEVGHLLGAAHDRAHAATAGHFSYAYGYGVEGSFGDIMSYYSPQIGLFANPDRKVCEGQPCGVRIGNRGEADVASTFGNTGTIVERFLQGPSQ